MDIKDKAKQLWLKAGGNNAEKGTLTLIADELGVSQATVRSWKNRYKWDNATGKSETKGKKKRNVAEAKEKVVKEKNATKDEDEKLVKHISEIINESEIEEIVGENLTERQKMFCWNYARTFNVRSSAVKAGYSLSYATSKIYDLMQHDKIKNYLEEIKNKMFSRVEISTELLYERHCAVAFSDAADFLNPDGTLRNLNEVDGSLVKKVTSNTKKETTERFGTEGETTSIKIIDEVKTSLELEDRSKSLEFLTKFHGLDPTVEMSNKKFEMEKQKLNTTTKEKLEEWLLSLSEEQINELLEKMNNGK